MKFLDLPSVNKTSLPVSSRKTITVEYSKLHEGELYTRPKISKKMTLAYQTLPQDANQAGNVHGGIIMKLIDIVAAAAATKHTRSNCVTASMDRMDFREPVFVGDMVTIRATVNYTGKTSMEVGVRAEAENLLTGEVRHTASAYLTFVSLDKNGCPKKVPKLIPENEREQRRFHEGEERQKMRQKLRVQYCKLKAKNLKTNNR